MIVAKIYLTVIQDEQPGDGGVLATRLPWVEGDETDENLACGSCKAVIVRGVTTTTLHNMFKADGRLIVACICGAKNIIPSRQD